MAGYQYRGKRSGAADPWQQTSPPRQEDPKPAKAPEPLKPCGTNAAYVRHRARGEQPCAECTLARREYVAEQRRTNPNARRRALAQCGTYSGAVRHYRLKEELCEPCVQARRGYINQRRQQQREREAA